MRERAHHFGDRIRMHIGRLHRHERTELLCILQNDLRNKPGIDQGVVSIDENALTTAFFAPACDSFYLIDVPLSRNLDGLRTSAKHFKLNFRYGVNHRTLPQEKTRSGK